MPPFLIRSPGLYYIRRGHVGEIRGRGRGRAGLRLRRRLAMRRPPIEEPVHNDDDEYIEELGRVLFGNIGVIQENGQGREGLNLNPPAPPNVDLEQANPLATLQADRVPDPLPHPEASPDDSVDDDVTSPEPLALPEVSQQVHGSPYSSTSESGLDQHNYGSPYSSTSESGLDLPLSPPDLPRWPMSFNATNFLASLGLSPFSDSSDFSDDEN